MSTSTRLRLVFDTQEMRPACVLLQEILGGDSFAAQMFNSETWLLAPTDEMKCFEIDRDRLRALAEAVNRHHKAGTLSLHARKGRDRSMPPNNLAPFLCAELQKRERRPDG